MQRLINFNQTFIERQTRVIKRNYSTFHALCTFLPHFDRSTGLSVACFSRSFQTTANPCCQNAEVIQHQRASGRSFDFAFTHLIEAISALLRSACVQVPPRANIEGRSNDYVTPRRRFVRRPCTLNFVAGPFSLVASRGNQTPS